MDGTDAEVIEASLGDPSLFGEVFRRHYDTVFGYVVRTVGYPDGPDVAAEVFEQAFRSRRRYDTSYPSARRWLLGIAAHLVAGYYRRREKRRTVPYQEPVAGESVIDFTDEVLGRVDASRLIGRAMGGLRPAEREVVSLFVFGGFSYREIAETVGVAEGTVRSRLSRAKGKLRNLLVRFGQYTGEGPETSDG
ncbi:ECF RNA polymerase sigma factor SigE [bacterium BMS3Bbin01]|nr:ECF RNA polymerase sigma factor SigE [bacterium BMS3Bbin01]